MTTQLISKCIVVPVDRFWSRIKNQELYCRWIFYRQ